MSQYLKSPLMDQPLLISSIIQHIDRHFGSNELSRTRLNAIFTVTLTEIVTAARGNWSMPWLAWNGYRHMEA